MPAVTFRSPVFTSPYFDLLLSNFFPHNFLYVMTPAFYYSVLLFHYCYLSAQEQYQTKRKCTVYINHCWTFNLSVYQSEIKHHLCLFLLLPLIQRSIFPRILHLPLVHCSPFLRILVYLPLIQCYLLSPLLLHLPFIHYPIFPPYSSHLASPFSSVFCFYVPLNQCSLLLLLLPCSPLSSLYSVSFINNSVIISIRLLILPLIYLRKDLLQ